MHQYFFNDLYFNLICPGIISTTWTWDGLEKISNKNNLVELFDYEINTETKLAKQVNYTGKDIVSRNYTGQVSQLI